MSPEQRENVEKMIAKQEAETAGFIRTLKREMEQHDKGRGWVVRIHDEKLPTYITASDEGTFSVLHARVMTWPQADELSTRARNGKGNHGEAITYHQALEEAVTWAQSHLESHRASVYELMETLEE